MKTRVVVLGAGFGGLELTTILAETLGDGIDIILIDKGDAFVFGFSKLDVMFGHQTAAAVHHPYREIVKPGVRFVQAIIESFDPVARRVVTAQGTFEADVLVVALGADYDVDATPGLGEGGNEFYSVAGAEQLAPMVRDFDEGRAIVGVCGAPFKCPPAPSEAALLLHDHLTARGVRDNCQITFVLPLPSPVPPSPETSAALMEAFAERDIAFVPGARIASLDPERRVAVLDDGTEMPYDLFLGVPVHRAPAVVVESGLTVDGWIPVNPATLETNIPGVYAVGDVTSVGTPKAGVFAEGQAIVVADAIIARIRDAGGAATYDGKGTCYLEFGHDQVAKVDVTFVQGAAPRGTLEGPSPALAADKVAFGTTRIQRWFGRTWPTPEG